MDSLCRHRARHARPRDIHLHPPSTRPPAIAQRHAPQSQQEPHTQTQAVPLSAPNLAPSTPQPTSHHIHPVDALVHRLTREGREEAHGPSQPAQNQNGGTHPEQAPVTVTVPAVGTSRSAQMDVQADATSEMLPPPPVTVGSMTVGVSGNGNGTVVATPPPAGNGNGNGGGNGSGTKSKKRKNPPAPNTYDPVGPGKSWRKGLKGNHNKSAKIEGYPYDASTSVMLEPDYRIQQRRVASPGASSAASGAAAGTVSGPPAPPPVIQRPFHVSAPPKVSTTFILPSELDVGKPPVRKWERARRSWVSVSGLAVGVRTWAGMPTSRYAAVKALEEQAKLSLPFHPGSDLEPNPSNTSATGPGKGKGKRKGPAPKKPKAVSGSVSAATATTSALPLAASAVASTLYAPSPAAMLPYPNAHSAQDPPSTSTSTLTSAALPSLPASYVPAPLQDSEGADQEGAVPLYLGADGKPVPTPAPYAQGMGVYGAPVFM
ncbi:hypothetical protein BT69DRAFT_628146 [Atractiella rhizophila]|nr:hypothetical protein BT69DRAFT_628146 [Atractiella rhizophila]